MPFLFSLYTAESRISSQSCSLNKFADDPGLTGLVTNGDETEYRREVNNFVSWCDNNFLELKVSKTKEMIIEFRRNKQQHADILVNGETIEQVDKYKYLGIVVDK